MNQAQQVIDILGSEQCYCYSDIEEITQQDSVNTDFNEDYQTEVNTYKDGSKVKVNYNYKCYAEVTL